MKNLKTKQILIYGILSTIVLLVSYFLWYGWDSSIKFMNIDINNSIIILFIFVENISFYTIKNPIFNDLLLNISYIFSNFHYLEGSLIDSNIHSIMEKELNKPSLMTQPGNDGDPDNENLIVRTTNGSSNNNNNEPVNSGNNSGSNMQNADDDVEEEEDDVGVENLMDDIDELLAEKKVIKKECEELEEVIERKVANDSMDEIISDTGNSKSLKRSREEDNDDEAPARKVYKHMEGSHSEILSDLESKRKSLRGIDKSLNSALKEVKDVYDNTEFQVTKNQLSNYIDNIDIPQEKKDAIIPKDH